MCVHVYLFFIHAAYLLPFYLCFLKAGVSQFPSLTSLIFVYFGFILSSFVLCFVILFSWPPFFFMHRPILFLILFCFLPYLSFFFPVLFLTFFSHPLSYFLPPFSSLLLFFPAFSFLSYLILFSCVPSPFSFILYSSRFFILLLSPFLLSLFTLIYFSLHFFPVLVLLFPFLLHDSHTPKKIYIYEQFLSSRTSYFMNVNPRIYIGRVGNLYSCT